MKKLILVICALSFVGSSCDTNCNDCGPTGYERFYLKNSSGEKVNLTWFKRPSGISEEFSINETDTIILFEASKFIGNSTGTLGVISKEPFGSSYTYDSVQLVFESKTLTYTNSECNLTGNPLCEGNYQLIKSVDTKDKKIKEWLFEIK